MANFRVTVARRLARTTERHVVQDRAVIPDHRGLADHETGGVIEEDAAPDPGRGMDIALENRRRAALQIIGEVRAALLPEPVGEAMGLDRVKTFEIEHWLEKAVGRGMTIEGRQEIGAKWRPDRSG